PQCWPKPAPARKLLLRRHSAINVSSPALAIFTYVKRCFARGCHRNESPPRLPTETASRTSAPKNWSTPSRLCSRTQSKRAAPHCAATLPLTAHLAISSTIFRSMPAKASRAQIAKERSNALCRWDARPSIAPHARNSPRCRLNAGGNRMRKLGLIAFIFAAMPIIAAAAEFPDHPIRFIVPQAAGSATDTVARVLAAELTKEFGQQVIVDDRPGGALTIGLDLVAKSPPDGYTIGMGPIGALAITRHMVAKLPYNIEKDFQPI